MEVSLNSVVFAEAVEKERSRLSEYYNWHELLDLFVTGLGCIESGRPLPPQITKEPRPSSLLHGIELMDVSNLMFVYRPISLDDQVDDPEVRWALLNVRALERFDQQIKVELRSRGRVYATNVGPGPARRVHAWGDRLADSDGVFRPAGEYPYAHDIGEGRAEFMGTLMPSERVAVLQLMWVSPDGSEQELRFPLGPTRRSRPGNSLDWSRLSADDFERLMFELLAHSEGYENVNLPTRTRSQDRGRDIEAYRVFRDPLAGTRRFRLIVQCRHTPNASIGVSTLSTLLEAVKLWEPPTIDFLVVATTGRFSQDAVAYAEGRDRERSLPKIELWPDTHLEHLLAQRRALVERFNMS